MWNRIVPFVWSDGQTDRQTDRQTRRSKQAFFALLRLHVQRNFILECKYPIIKTLLNRKRVHITNRFHKEKILMYVSRVDVKIGKESRKHFSRVPATDTTINIIIVRNMVFNPLRTKLYLSNLKTQFVSRRKHSLPRL